MKSVIKSHILKTNPLRLFLITILAAIIAVLSGVFLLQKTSVEVKAQEVPIHPVIVVEAAVNTDANGTKTIGLTVRHSDDEDTNEQLANSSAWRWTVIVDDNADDLDNLCDATVFAADSGNTVVNRESGSTPVQVSWGTVWAAGERKYVCFEITDSDGNAGYGQSNVISYDDIRDADADAEQGSSAAADSSDRVGKVTDSGFHDSIWPTVVIIVGILASVALPIALYNIYKRGNHLR